uniref:Transposase n=1 Tax=Candidatus Kentrum sp. TC TaxID=2126339 RepID=A0A450YW33_9GAMM|nr:MAG: hypothetical protein BECKTC1821D_GA0114238_102615 [Candidatus Kentron sp. TC]
MKNDIRKGQVKVLGIDLLNQGFQLHGENKRGHTVLQKKSSRGKLVAYVTNLPPCLIGMEACARVRIIGIGFSRRWGIACV